VAPKDKGYQTDLLVADWISDEHWRPLVVIECKYGKVDTHDLITYSRKAEAHRTLHPYLRYGLVVGGFPGEIPGRMLAHGAAFDFLAMLPETNEQKHFRKLTALLSQEVSFARNLWTAFKDGAWENEVLVIHRPLVTGWPTT
jgi:hypothetical protein